MIRAVILGLLLASATARAEPGLPPEAAVEAALDAHPMVAAAEARRAAARADQRGLAAGMHELTAGGSLMRRRIDGRGDVAEFDATLSRAFRLPGKARLDRMAGDAGVRFADNMAEDARHQAAILLNDLWWGWLGASASADVLAGSVTTLEQALKATRQRAGVRDASAMDVEQAEVAVGSARVAALAAAGQAAAARAALAAQFPDLPLPGAAPALPPPELPVEGAEALGRLVIERSHEIGAAVAQTDRQQAVADRVKRDRLADPTFGVRGFSEQGGNERGFGLLFSLPLGGTHRAALADKARAEAIAAEADARVVRQGIAELAGRDVALALSARQAWQAAETAAGSAASVASRMARGHALGGIDLADRLYAQRQAQESALAEAVARTEALKAISRLRIDSHVLWIHPDEHDQPR